MQDTQRTEILEYVYRTRKKVDSTLIRISTPAKEDLEAVCKKWDGITQIAALDYLLRLADEGFIPHPFSLGNAQPAPGAPAREG